MSNNNDRSAYEAELLADAPRLTYDEGSEAQILSYQKAILGCIFADPVGAAKVAFAELSEGAFPDSLCAKAFAAARDLYERELPIAPDTVEHELLERYPELPIDAIALKSFLLSVVTYIEGPWTVKYYVSKLKDATRARDLARMFRQSADWIEVGHDYDGNEVSSNDVADVLREVVEKKREHEHPAALSLGDFLRSPPERPKAIWGDIICAGEGTFIAAEAKLGKTMLTQNIALAIAGGATEFLGHKITPARVLVLQAEVHPAFYLRRIEAMLDHAAGSIDVKRAKEELILFPDGFLMLSTSHSQNGGGQRVLRDRAFLEAELEKWHPNILIADPLYVLFPNAEAGLEDSGEVFAFLNKLRQTYGCALVLVHHTRKPPGMRGETNTMLSMRGSSSLPAWPSGSMVLGWPNGGEVNRSHIRVNFALRNAPDLPVTYWRRPTADFLWFSPDPDFVEGSSGEKRSLTGAQELLAALEFCGPLAPQELAAEITKRAKCAERTAWARIKEASQADTIQTNTCAKYELAKISR